MKKPFIFHLIFLFQCIVLMGQVSLLDLQKGFQWRNIGPANQGGRIVDIEAQNDDFTKVIMATGSGGVWKSDNAGTSWTPIFDKYETASIGDIALDQSRPNIIWVGTGEANNRNSVSWGNGIYKSVDGGESFKNLGLENTHQIARIIINPKKPDEVCVCAIGHLWGRSGDRGIFKTKDGGKSWEKLTKGLPDDGKGGCIDMVIDPNKPNTLYAAFYDRLRRPWTFTSGGENGGIYKTTNGGKSWEKLTNGLPEGPTGRIGLAIYQKNPKILMALVEAERTDTLAIPGSGVYRTEDGGKSWSYVNTYNNRPFYYSQIRINPNDDQRIYLLTTRFMVSDDGGKTLRNGSEDQEVHGDFHAMWLDPSNKDRYYLGADKGISITHDHGEHFTLFDNIAIGQFYRIGYDMRDPYIVYGGLQDNGMYGLASFSRDARGILNDSSWKLHWGDGEYVTVDPTNWRNVYTSSENGSYNKYDPVTHRIYRISPNPKNTLNYNELFPEKIEDIASAFRFNWSAPMRISPHDPNTLYVAGNYVYRSRDQGQSWMIISPDLTTNHEEKRVQGQSGGITPDNSGAETHCSASSLSISPIAEDIIWLGTDDGLVHVTQDNGDTWTPLRSNIPEVPEEIWVSRVEASHFDKATAYVSFDGHRSDHFGTWLFKTTDFGKTWTKITGNITEGEVIRVVREDHKNPSLLFVGTETSVWYTVDGGASWARFMEGMPTVSVYDLKIHPRDNDLIIGTHGRSIWVVDDISPLQEMNEEIMNASAHLFEQRRATLWENVSRGGQRGHFWFAGDNPLTIENTSSVPRAAFKSKAAITYFVGAKNTEDITLKISDMANKHTREIVLDAKPGIHRYYWDREFEAEAYTDEELAFLSNMLETMMAQYSSNTLRRLVQRFRSAESPTEQRKVLEPFASGYWSQNLDAKYLMPKAGPGVYKVSLISNGEVQTTTLEVREDPIIKE